VSPHDPYTNQALLNEGLAHYTLGDEATALRLADRTSSSGRSGRLASYRP
jgi:hypothetical protein